MSDTLAERLAQRLDIQPEQTERLVRTLAQLIKTQASRDGQVRVPGLGIFEQRADALTFEPDPQFAEAVNPKYAHLPTVSVAPLTPAVADAQDEADAVVAQEEPEPQGDTTPTVEAEDVDLPAFAPPVEPEEISEEEDTEEEYIEEEPPALTSFLDEDEPAETDDDTAFAITPPPLPEEEIKQDISDASTEEEEEPIAEEEPAAEDDVFPSEEPVAEDDIFPYEEPDVEDEEPTAEDEVSYFDEPDLDEEPDTEAAPVFADESTWEEEADQDDEDFIASLLADEPEDLDEEEEDAFAEEPLNSEDGDEDTFEDFEPIEEDTYAALDEESASFEEDTFLEEGEPSAWAPPGTRWTGENKDQLVPIEDDETESDATPPPLSIEDTEPDEEVFASSPLKAVPKASLEAPAAAEDDLPPRPSPRIRHYQEPAPSERSVWPWLLAAFLFVVIAGGAYYYFNLREQPIATNDPTPTTEQPTDTDDPAVTPPTEENAQAEDPTAETDTAPDDVAEETPPSEETTPAQPPASTGAIDRVQGGYTLVIGSRGSREAAAADAERVRQALNDDTIPVDVLQGTVNGTTRYRIGVGQVATTDAALALKQRLGNRIPADAWVTRILPDS